jgi:hypothetical protein
VVTNFGSENLFLFLFLIIIKDTNQLFVPDYQIRGFSPQTNYTDRRLSAKLVPTLADRGCRVVSAINPQGR